MRGVRLVNLVKQFGNTVAVDNISLEVESGKILTLLGPSGCGKTTTMRCIAGFITPEKGEIYLGDRLVTNVPVEKRGVGFVFQNYALWPHMNVFENLAFGLRLKRISKSEIETKVREALDTVQLGHLAERHPRQLSGGQQQRVALARALVIEPGVLLLDEPLSNLDAQLREEMRFEIRALQRKLGITTIYVTHDQDEALALSDYIAVMKDGHINQLDTPENIYSYPANRFVAGFIGLSSFLDGTVTRVETDNAVISIDDQLEIRVAKGKSLSLHQKVTLAIRPEHITLTDQETVPEGHNILYGQVTQLAYIGDAYDYRIKIGNWTVRANTPASQYLPVDTNIKVVIPQDAITIITDD